MLSEEQIVEMAPRIKYMMQTPGWQDYLKVISDKLATTVEIGFSGTPEDLRYHQGCADGLRAAVLSGDDVLAWTREVTGEKREARRNAIASGAQLSSFE
jgi:hypothetical protein